jgi:hypothetical protein
VWEGFFKGGQVFFLKKKSLQTHKKEKKKKKKKKKKERKEKRPRINFVDGNGQNPD